MKYTIEVFDKDAELLAFEIDLPKDCDAQLSNIMGWSIPQRGDEGYDLDIEQIAAIEVLAGRSFYDK